MVRETFGQAVDDALARLEYAGVPRDAVAVIRQRLRRDKRIVAAAIDATGVVDHADGLCIALADLRRKGREYDRLIGRARAHGGIARVVLEDGHALVWPRGEGDAADARESVRA